MKFEYLLLLGVSLVTRALSAKYSQENDISEELFRNDCQRETWMWKLLSAFTVNRIPQNRTLFGTCSFDIGACPAGRCPFNAGPNRKCQKDGYICSQLGTRAVDCGFFGIANVSFVTACTCCEDAGIEVNIIVTNSRTRAPISDINLLVNSRSAGTSNIQGQVNTSIPSPRISQLVIIAMDPTNVYVDAIKIIDIPPSFKGPIDAGVDMVARAKAITIDALTGANLSLSSTPENPLAGNAKIEILPGSFRTRVGLSYRGHVQASVTFLNTSVSDIENSLPGRFLYENEYGKLDMLISDCIVFLDFRDIYGNPLMIGPIRFTVRTGMKLWNLNYKGYWVRVPPLKRYKRQVALTDTFFAQVNTAYWTNIGRIPSASPCYFKARIFDQTTGVEIQTSATTIFKPDVLAFTQQNQRLRMYMSATSLPNSTCYEVRCSSPSTARADVLIGFINMTSYESVLIGNVSLPYQTSLTPSPIYEYDVSIQPMLQAMNYAVLPNNMDIFANFVSSIDGPFFTNRTTCEASPSTQPAVHFLKPPLPNYEPVRETAAMCTAKIAFNDGYRFYEYLFSLTELPIVTSLSIWNNSWSIFQYTDASTLQYSRIDDVPIFYACLKYRCSQGSELTTVYLDINVPMLDANATMVNETQLKYSAFTCYGRCSSPLCIPNFSTPNNSSIDGTFDVMANVGDGPDFFNTTVNGCNTITTNDKFAYTFVCFNQWYMQFNLKK